ncbi:MAG: MSMEG_4193 family putative phosphomutase [Nitriliruptoraceae bacterium]
MTTILLLRHATTAATGRRLGGWTPGVHLDKAGQKAAATVGEALGGQPIAAVYASPLERTRETAAPVAKPHGVRVKVRRELGEVEYGTWTNQPLSRLRKRPLWGPIQTVPSRVTFPEGESLRAAQFRAVSFVESLVVTHPDEWVVCVSHADVIKAVLAQFLGMPLDVFQRLRIDPASVSVLQLSAYEQMVDHINLAPGALDATFGDRKAGT